MKTCINCGNFSICELEERKRLHIPETTCLYHAAQKIKATEKKCAFCGAELTSRAVVRFGDNGDEYFCSQKHLKEYDKT